MKNIRIFISFRFLLQLLFCSGCISAQADKKHSLGEQPIFKATKTSESILVDGKMDEAIWKKLKPEH